MLGRALARTARLCLVLMTLLAGLPFPQAALADDPVKGEATFSAASGYARLMLKLAEDVESDVTTATGQKAETEAARFKGIITMYEGMKPKDAAKVFDRLEMSVLYDIASQIAPRKMSDILGLMQPEAAERLTVELARRAGSDKSASTAELPKIEGKMMQQKPN